MGLWLWCWCLAFAKVMMGGKFWRVKSTSYFVVRSAVDARIG
jgi:hypothetical protein